MRWLVIARFFRWLLGPCERPCCAHTRQAEAFDTTRLRAVSEVSPFWRDHANRK